MEESKFIYVEGKTIDEIAVELTKTIRKGKFKAFAGMEEETFEEIDQAAGEYFD